VVWSCKSCSTDQRTQLVRRGRRPRHGSAVFLANDLRHDRRVAIKVFRSELAEVMGAERFFRKSESPRSSTIRTF
jgi:hypothetical protein